MRYIDTTSLYAKQNTWGNRAELWKNKNLQKDFRNYFYNKCWYTETLLDGSDKPIDHFRPKGKIIPFEDYDYNKPTKTRGYDWLKNDYKNYRCCCTYANRKTGEGGKSCYFPLMSTVYLTNGGVEIEEPALLDPLVKSDVELMYFDRADIMPSKTDAKTVKRVQATKSVYNLTHFDFEPRRVKIWENVERIIARYKAGKIDLEVCIEDLSELISKEAMHSACAISAVNSLAMDDIKRELNLDL